MEITFQKARYRTRLFAFVFDFLLMVVPTLCMMLATRAIVSNADYYKKANAAINELQLSSHLYEKRSDGIAQLMSDYYIPKVEEDYPEINSKLDNAMVAFFSDPVFFNQSDVKSGLYIYRCLKIPEGQTSSDLFIFSDETHSTIVAKDGVSQEALHNFYCDAMNNHAAKYILQTDTYINNSRTISLSFYFIILLIPIVLSSLIFELIIPLCFRRGKKTLGKLILKLSVVDDRGLSCSWKRFTLRYLLVLFFETIIAIVTFLLPIIISFSMFVFSKAGQSFHDYVTGTYVVEASSKSICITKEEYIQKHEKDEKFALKKEDVVY